jgi:hypothetical protein
MSVFRTTQVEHIFSILVSKIELFDVDCFLFSELTLFQSILQPNLKTKNYVCNE